ncbi:hypothetical protein V8C40DRAFT_262546 [Trichoderma camerunense]
MDSLACHVIYVNRSVGEARLLRAIPDDSAASPTGATPDWRRDRVRELVQPLLDTFGDVHVCATGAACMDKLMQLHEAGSMMDMTPTMVLLDTPHDEWIPESYSNPNSSSPDPNFINRDAEIHTPDENLYGLTLLQRLITEAHLRSISKLVVPIPIISYPETREQMTDGTTEPLPAQPVSRKLIRRCLDLGAVDVIISPLGPKCIATLEICAYKAHRDAARDQQAMMEITKGRKRSWVGVNDQKPFAYLREAMVSGLMKGICRLSPEDDNIAGAHIAVSSERQAIIAEAVGRWHFDAHEFSDDELLVAAMQMFKHALTSPELERWRIPAVSDQLISFLVACRAAYNSFVPYHNFRHVVDVLQATFNFLVHIGAFPPYPTWSQPRSKVQRSPIASLVSPYEALTLLVTAIGHDVGHPGVNNGFLTTLNAPLAQLYNDRSVLESFHCAAFSQILRRYWPAVFEDRKMRGLMISSILATDMGLHFDYMKKMATLKENPANWNGRQVEDAKVLACSLLIKCADISNVARRQSTALKWMHMLSEEFSRQASMEDELEIKSSLMSPPKKDILSLANAQIGFMNMFAIPLFQGVAEIMPGMEYAVKELHINKKFFEEKVKEEQVKAAEAASENVRHRRTRSYPIENDSEMKNIEISPAPSPSTAKSGHDPHTPVEHPDVNGMAFGVPSSFDAADGDPFTCHRPDDSIEGKLVSTKQRTSETTEGSLSAGYPADWASQAASTATGKMTLSPSTQGTSIVSNESGERTLSVPAFNMSPLSLKGSPTSPRREREREREREMAQGDEDSHLGGSIGRAEGKALKKRPSRFRMKDFPFFKRSKGSSPPFPTADTSG